MSSAFEYTARDMLDFPEQHSTSGYCNRGRRHEGLAADVLRARWASAFRRWMDLRTFERETALDDLASELCLRNLPLPLDLVSEEWARMRDELAGADPEALWDQ